METSEEAPRRKRGEAGQMSNVKAERPKVEHREVTVDDLSPDQKQVYDKTLEWVESKSKLLTIGGYAGTGKSTVVTVLATSGALDPVAFCALTGKAAGVLRKKLGVAGVDLHRNSCSTIHSLVYRAVEDGTGTIIGWERRVRLPKPFKMIVVDEASMVDENTFRDLQAFGIPILAVGDHGQLPPVGGSFSLMQSPTLRLEQIHRQAADNPIIRLSSIVRETGRIPWDCAAPPYINFARMNELPRLVAERYRDASPERLGELGIVSYTNGRRCAINALVRHIRVGDSKAPPVEGDQIIVLKNTKGDDVTPPLFNGMRGFVTTPCVKQDDDLYHASVSFPDEGIAVPDLAMCPWQFGRDKTFSNMNDFHAHGVKPGRWDEVGHLIDYGYALTAHKSQGSSYRELIVLAERPGPADDATWKRWLYTAITRCSEFLTVVR